MQEVYKMSVIHPKDADAPSGGVDDMTKLAYLHEPGVLANLRTRYTLDEIYVRQPESICPKLTWQCLYSKRTADSRRL